MHKRTYFYSHPDFLLHHTGTFHPESAARLTAIETELTTTEFAHLTHITPLMAENVQDLLQLVHTFEHIQQVYATAPLHDLAYLDNDTLMSPGSLHAALLAVSTACAAVAAVRAGQADNAFCALRPPGHHAEPDRAMGFCLFNNVAIAAEYARHYLAINKVAIVDFDVHHGNGVQAAFYQQPQVLYVSSHQSPFYPGTGAASEIGVGNILNIPLPAGSDGELMRAVYRQRVLPALHAFQPEIMLICAGFDAHADDPLSGLNWRETDYYWITAELMQIAAQYCQGRVVSVLEGGYDLPALAASVAEHVRALAGIPAKALS